MASKKKRTLKIVAAIAVGLVLLVIVIALGVRLTAYSGSPGETETLALGEPVSIEWTPAPSSTGLYEKLFGLDDERVGVRCTARTYRSRGQFAPQGVPSEHTLLESATSNSWGRELLTWQLRAEVHPLTPASDYVVSLSYKAEAWDSGGEIAHEFDEATRVLTVNVSEYFSGGTARMCTVKFRLTETGLELL